MSVQHIQTDIYSSIQKANSFFEEGWSNLAKLSKLFNAEEENIIALSKVISYNPNNQLLISYPFYSAIVLLTDTISQLIKCKRMDNYWSLLPYAK